MNDHAKALQNRIFYLLGAGPSEPSRELLDLLSELWAIKKVDFPSKMAAWKAHRITDLRWNNPQLEFAIQRHPGAWERVQRWRYDFETNEARLVSERGVRKNPSYTSDQVLADAQGIVRALERGESHPCIEAKGDLLRVWLGRLPLTRGVAFTLPQRTARGRQQRLKIKVAELVEVLTQFERDASRETTGSLVYRCRD